MDRLIDTLRADDAMEYADLDAAEAKNILSMRLHTSGLDDLACFSPFCNTPPDLMHCIELGLMRDHFLPMLVEEIKQECRGKLNCALTGLECFFT